MSTESSQDSRTGLARVEDAPGRPFDGEGGPSPAPRSRLAELPGPWQTTLMLLRVLRRMSTALWLLFALAASSVVATFVPQEPVIPPTVAAWLAGTEGPGMAVAALLDAAGLFDVYGSWWFLLLVAALVASLTGCLVPRWRAWVRTAGRPPVAGRNLDRLRNHSRIDSPLPPADALAAAEEVLRRKRFRVRRSESGQVAAERGHAREGGSLLFHTSFYIMLAGAVIGHAFGFTGQVNVVEGQRFAEYRIAYGGYQPGRYWSLDDHRGFVVSLEDFEVSYHEPGPGSDVSADVPVALVPRDFTSTVTFHMEGQPPETRQVRVNHPARFDGLRLYQARFGYAPAIEVRGPDGGLLFEERVLLAEEGIGIWTGVAKVASTDREQQIALELVLLTDAAFTGDGVPFSRSPEATNPRLAAVLWYGRLGLERNVPASQFDRERGRRLAQPLMLAPGEAATYEELPLEVAFTDLPHWSGFQVSHEPGRWLLLTGAILLVAGLLASLYSYRRRVWVEALPAGDGSSVTLAGVALQRKMAFAEAFTELDGNLRAALGERRGAEAGSAVGKR